MQLPVIIPAPLVKAHAEAFRDLFENLFQFRHFENYLTGLMVLPNKSMANITRCVIESSDKTNLSRYFSKDLWLQDQVNDRRIKYMLQETKHVRVAKDQSALILNDTLCEHVGSLFEYVDHHYNHGDGNYPLAHNPVTSHYVSGPVRFPVDLRLYRRYEEVTRWEEFVHKHFPERKIPNGKKERTKFHKEVDAVLLQNAEYQALHEQLQTKIALAKELVEAAIRRKLPFSVVLFDSWYLAEEFVACLRRRRKDWISTLRLKNNRNLETNSFVLKGADGKTYPLISVENLVTLIPAKAYRAVQVGDQTYWTFTLSVRLPGLGKVRLVISFDNPQLKGTYAVLVSNRVEWTALRMIATYLHRWPIETFYQDGKEHLGFDEYRMRNAKATLREKHWCLVFVAYSLLHLDCLPASLKQSRLPIKTIGEACRQQAQSLIEALILYASQQLDQRQKANDLFAYLFAKQHAFAVA